jgi:hypothetical protein
MVMETSQWTFRTAWKDRALDRSAHNALRTAKETRPSCRLHGDPYPYMWGFNSIARRRPCGMVIFYVYRSRSVPGLQKLQRLQALPQRRRNVRRLQEKVVKKRL